MNDLARLQAILTYKRPHGTKGVDDFVTDIFAGYDYTVLRTPTSKSPLALVIEVGQGSKTLFSAHVDTVHRTSGRQAVCWDEGTGLAYMPDELTSECLGADDGAGVWLLLQMIDAGVPGVYVLPHGEERGGIGSMGLVDYHEDFLKRFDRAVAFDRRGTTSVISHQGMGRCCSDVFALELAACLNDANPRLSMAPDNTGVFTDTANYVALIPECTNVSCGYEHEHSNKEMLDFEYLLDLRDAVLLVNWEALPTERTPEDTKWSRWGDYEDPDSLSAMTYKNLLAWVKKNAADPELVADTLYEALDRMSVAEAYEYEEQDDSMGIIHWTAPDDDDDRLDISKW